MPDRILTMPNVSVAPSKACAHYDAGTHRCSQCRVRLISVCAALSPAELEDIEQMGQSRTFAARHLLASQDEPADSVFTITEGMVRLYRLLPDGRRQILGFALPGDFLGLSLFDIYGFSAEAVTDGAACRFSRKAFLSYVEQHPRLLRRLHEFASHELSLAQDQLVVLGRRSADERLAAFLIMMRDRFRRLGHSSPNLPIPMSRQDIADYLGLTIETVSRTFTKFARAKTIASAPNGVTLLDERKLERLTAQ